MSTLKELLVMVEKLPKMKPYLVSIRVGEGFKERCGYFIAALETGRVSVYEDSVMIPKYMAFGYFNDYTFKIFDARTDEERILKNPPGQVDATNCTPKRP